MVTRRRGVGDLTDAAGAIPIEGEDVGDRRISEKRTATGAIDPEPERWVLQTLAVMFTPEAVARVTGKTVEEVRAIVGNPTASRVTGSEAGR